MMLVIPLVFIFSFLGQTFGLECYECETVRPYPRDHPSLITDPCGYRIHGRKVMKVTECSENRHAKFCATHLFELVDLTMVKIGCLDKRHESDCNKTTKYTTMNCCFGSLCNMYEKSTAYRPYQNVLLLIVFVFTGQLLDINYFVA